MAHPRCVEVDQSGLASAQWRTRREGTRVELPCWRVERFVTLRADISSLRRCVIRDLVDLTISLEVPERDAGLARHECHVSRCRCGQKNFQRREIEAVAPRPRGPERVVRHEVRPVVRLGPHTVWNERSTRNELTRTSRVVIGDGVGQAELRCRTWRVGPLQATTCTSRPAVVGPR